jgi:AsmA protein
VPESTDPTTLTSARVTGEFVVDARRGEFRNLDVKLDDTQITGSLGVNDFESPSYRFDLRADAVDVDRYLPPPVEEAEDGERKAGDIELASEPLSAFRIDGFARVRDLRLSGMRFRAVETTLKIGDGRASITPASARLYGGEFTGGLEVDATGEIPTMSLNGQATDLNLRPLIRSLLGESNLTGTGNFDLDLTGTGPTVTDVLRTAAGTMSFALRDGAISGFNLGRTLCAAYNLSQKLPQPADAPDQTDYQLIRAAATVSDGIASSPDVLARTAFMDVTGSGRLILVDQILDYDMDAKLTNSIGIARCDSMDPLIGDSIPFTIRGPVTDADIKPDFGQILENRVRDEIRDRAEDRLRNRLEDRLRNLL